MAKMAVMAANIARLDLRIHSLLARRADGNGVNDAARPGQREDHHWLRKRLREKLSRFVGRCQEAGPPLSLPCARRAARAPDDQLRRQRHVLLLHRLPLEEPEHEGARLTTELENRL